MPGAIWMECAIKDFHMADLTSSSERRECGENYGEKESLRVREGK